MHKYKNKVQNNRDYAPGLAWVRFNQKLAFHHDNTIIKTPSFLLHPDDSMIHHHSYYDIRRDVNRQQYLQLGEHDKLRKLTS
jgi:hypothetical protein